MNRGRLHPGHDSFTWTVLSRSEGGGGRWRMGWCEGAQRQASIWPLRHQQGPMTKGGSALKSRPPQTSLGILFRSPPFPLQSLSLFCQPSKQQRNVPSANQHSLGDCLYTCWLVIIVMADAKNVVQLSRLMCYVNICGIWGSADVHRDVCRVSSTAQRLSSRAFATIVSSMAINQVAWRAFMMSASPHLTYSSKSQTRDFPNIKSDL